MAVTDRRALSVAGPDADLGELCRRSVSVPVVPAGLAGARAARAFPKAPRLFGGRSAAGPEGFEPRSWEEVSAQCCVFVSVGSGALCVHRGKAGSRGSGERGVAWVGDAASAEAARAEVGGGKGSWAWHPAPPGRGLGLASGRQPCPLGPLPFPCTSSTALGARWVPRTPFTISMVWISPQYFHNLPA